MEEWKCEWCCYENEAEDKRCAICGKEWRSGTHEDYPREFHYASEIELGFLSEKVVGPEGDELVQNVDKAERDKATALLAGAENLSWDQARLALTLMELSYSRELAVEAASQCSTLERAKAFLNRLCPLCDCLYPESKIEKMYYCEHSACVLCAKQYFTQQIRERSILDLVCPVCSQPKLGHALPVHEYYAAVDGQFRVLLETDVYDLLQTKLRDFTLSNDPDFFWCPNCKDSFGFYPDLTLGHNRCPNCRISFCSKCKQEWKPKHVCVKNGRRQSSYVNELDRFLHHSHAECPSCGTRYELLRGGCMHLTCSRCKHSWCDGCRKPFYHGRECGMSVRCGGRGLHAHHPRNCFYFGRDRDYRKLQQLLTKHGVAFECESLPGSDPGCCPVLENGEEESEGKCGRTAEVDLAGLCVNHYREYLSRVICKAGLDPVDIMDTQDLVSELERNDVKVPEKVAHETDAFYYHRLKNFVVEALPFENSSSSGS